MDKNDRSLGNDNQNGWSEWGRYVLKTLEIISSRIDDLQKEVLEIKTKSVEEKFKLKENIRDGVEKEINQDIEKLESKINNNDDYHNKIKETIQKTVKELSDKVAKLDKDITVEKVKATLLGAILSLIGAGVISLIVNLLKEFIIK